MQITPGQKESLIPALTLEKSTLSDQDLTKTDLSDENQLKMVNSSSQTQLFRNADLKPEFGKADIDSSTSTSTVANDSVPAATKTLSSNIKTSCSGSSTKNSNLKQQQKPNQNKDAKYEIKNGHVSPSLTYSF